MSTKERTAIRQGRRCEKKLLISQILENLNYERYYQCGYVNISPVGMKQQLECLTCEILLNWYFSFIFFRTQTQFATIDGIMYQEVYDELVDDKQEESSDLLHCGSGSTYGEGVSDFDFFEDLIEDMLCQVDYRLAERREVVDISYEEMYTALRMLIPRVLLCWYLAYLHYRKDFIFRDYEYGGNEVPLQPDDVVKIMKEYDPEFSLDTYII